MGFNSGFKGLTNECHELCVIWGLRHEVDESCAVLVYYAASSGNFLPTFWDNLRGTVFKGEESTKESRLSQKEFIQGRVGTVTSFSVAWCQPRGLMQVVGRETVCYDQSSFEERRSLREEILTGVIGRHRRTSTWAKCEKRKEESALCE